MLKWLVSKKGFLGFSLVDAYSVVLIALTILVFLGIFIAADFVNRDKGQILESAKSSFENLIVINYLNSNVDGMKMAEFIELNRDDRKLIFEKTKDVMNKFCSKEKQPVCTWAIAIEFPDKKIDPFGTSIGSTTVPLTTKVAGYNNDYWIGLRLVYPVGGVKEK